MYDNILIPKMCEFMSTLCFQVCAGPGSRGHCGGGPQASRHLPGGRPDHLVHHMCSLSFSASASLSPFLSLFPVFLCLYLSLSFSSSVFLFLCLSISLSFSFCLCVSIFFSKTNFGLSVYFSC